MQSNEITVDLAQIPLDASGANVFIVSLLLVSMKEKNSQVPDTCRRLTRVAAKVMIANWSITTKVMVVNYLL